ncbi:MAG: hypothetical protein AABN34_14960 [Acidobacteriota bacterium]
MKRTLSSSLVLLVSLMLLLVGCKGRESASNNAAKPAAASSNASPADNSNLAQSASANRNANTSKETDTPAPVKTLPPQLVGTYEAREIQDKGVVTLVSKIRTLISFSAEGTYSRAAQANGKIYHSDSGQFRIEAPDKLVLTIQMSGQQANKKIQSPPLLKTHKFSLSPDGDELRLTSDKGATAIFRRIGKPKSS